MGKCVQSNGTLVALGVPQTMNVTESRYHDPRLLRSQFFNFHSSFSAPYQTVPISNLSLFQVSSRPLSRSTSIINFFVLLGSQDIHLIFPTLPMFLKCLKQRNLMRLLHSTCYAVLHQPEVCSPYLTFFSTHFSLISLVFSFNIQFSQVYDIVQHNNVFYSLIFVFGFYDFSILLKPPTHLRNFVLFKIITFLRIKINCWVSNWVEILLTYPMNTKKMCRTQFVPTVALIVSFKSCYFLLSYFFILFTSVSNLNSWVHMSVDHFKFTHFSNGIFVFSISLLYF